MARAGVSGGQKKVLWKCVILSLPFEREWYQSPSHRPCCVLYRSVDFIVMTV